MAQKTPQKGGQNPLFPLSPVETQIELTRFSFEHMLTRSHQHQKNAFSCSLRPQGDVIAIVIRYREKKNGLRPLFPHGCVLDRRAQRRAQRASPRAARLTVTGRGVNSYLHTSFSNQI